VYHANFAGGGALFRVLRAGDAATNETRLRGRRSIAATIRR